MNDFMYILIYKYMKSYDCTAPHPILQLFLSLSVSDVLTWILPNG